MGSGVAVPNKPLTRLEHDCWSTVGPFMGKHPKLVETLRGQDSWGSPVFALTVSSFISQPSFEGAFRNSACLSQQTGASSHEHPWNCSRELLFACFSLLYQGVLHGVAFRGVQVLR